LNKNIICKPHKDVGNVGQSMIFGCGNYKGGELVIDDIEYDINGKCIIFNGSEQEHYNKPFQGERYSIIYYSI
jgi:hypothetical protein